MLRIATRSTLIAALLACGTVVSLSAAEPCPRCAPGAGTPPGSLAAAHGVPATLSPSEAAPIVDAAAFPHGLQSAGGYGPAPYGPEGLGPGIQGRRGMTYGPVAASIARKYAPNCRPHTYGNPDLFANYYVPPTCGGAGAEIYPAPYPITPLVGHTYYTYQPFAPHELLYPHHRTYHRYYNGGRGLTRARVHWSVGPHTIAESLVQPFKFAR